MLGYLSADVICALSENCELWGTDTVMSKEETAYPSLIIGIYNNSACLFYTPGATLPGQYPGSPSSPISPRSPISPSRTLPRNFKSYHEASGVHTLLEQPSRYSISGSQTLPKNYKAISPTTSPVGSPTKPLEPAIDLPVSLVPDTIKEVVFKSWYRHIFFGCFYLFAFFHLLSPSI